MVREEVHRLQTRVDVLEQVRLCWEWLSLVSRPQSLRLWFQTMGWLEVLWGKGCRGSGFLTMPGSIVWDSPAWKERRFRAHLACCTCCLASLIKPQAP